MRRTKIICTLGPAVDSADSMIRLCDAVCSLSYEIIKSITARYWIVQCFN